MGVCRRHACVDNTIISENGREHRIYQLNKVGSEGAFPPRKISLVISCQNDPRCKKLYHSAPRHGATPGLGPGLRVVDPVCYLIFSFIFSEGNRGTVKAKQTNRKFVVTALRPMPWRSLIYFQHQSTSTHSDFLTVQ